MYVRAITKSFAVFSPVLLITSSILFSGCVTSPRSVSSQSTPTAVPVVNLAIVPATALPGQSATLTWSATSAASCTASGDWTGSQQMSGSINVALSSPAAQTYILDCAATGGPTIRKSVTLKLSPADGACTPNPAVVTARGRHVGKRSAPNGSHS